MYDKPTTLPAAFFDMPGELYHGGEWQREYVSSTQLKAYLVSPKYFRYTKKHGNEIGFEVAMRGNVYHAMLASLTNTGCMDDFEKEYFLFDAPVNPSTGQPYGISSAKYQAAYAEALAANPGKLATSKGDVEYARTMIEELLGGCGETSRAVQQLMQWGRAEASYFVEYKGRGFKFRPDLMTGRKIIDWKTVSSPDLREETLSKQIARMNYGISAAFYQFFDHMISGIWREFYWVFQQKEPPYDAVLVSADAWAYTPVDDGTVYKGDSAHKFEALLEQHIHCSEHDLWPGAEVFLDPGTGGWRIMHVNVPRYVREQHTGFYN